MRKKYYAVKHGRRNGIFFTWEECKKQIFKFPGAQYKSFENLQDADTYLNGIVKKDTKKTISKTTTAPIQNSDFIAYVDGSYNIANHTYGSGAVILHGDEKINISESGDDQDMASMRNVAGEIIASMLAMQYAIEKNATNLFIHYDYKGIEEWALGNWKTNKKGTKAYKDFYDSIKDDLNVFFIKVKAHSGDILNDEADILAKKAVGISC